MESQEKSNNTSTTTTSTTTDFSQFNDENRSVNVVIKEAVHYLAYLATVDHYHVQPTLWKMGEWGRARTLEDYTHHFVALSSLDTGVWKSHLSWCEGFWDSRKYPHEWLTDGWAIMREVITNNLHPAVAQKANGMLDMIPELTTWK
eukprot:Phypoly_transcript_23206.p1 GENE.Phypoly_transcript_23206~~Phypoly_transcript_23206.p1  ORF type:complete len:146 (+),score=18.13 Phypoly_transcript_23206:112-549(+)